MTAEYTSCTAVEAAIQDSLRTGRPALLLTDCGEAVDEYARALSGVCDGIGPDASDGTLRFYGSHDDGIAWDVRLRLSRPRERSTASRGYLEQQAERAELQLAQAVYAYKRERDTDAATAVHLAMVNADAARRDLVDLALEERGTA